MSARLEVDDTLIAKYGGPGPRYTSYPTADRFTNAHGPAAHAAALATRGALSQVSGGGWTAPLSLYVHLPFCNTVCYYCGCNKVITKNRGRAAEYLRHLSREIELVAGLLPGTREATQLHLGGGTPTFLTDAELAGLMDTLSRHFTLLPGEYAIEIDPRTVDAARVGHLAALGFNRMSLGVQDFDPEVQRAVNRNQGEDITREVIEAARRHGVRSLNLDLIYGLPRQSVASFATTLDKVVALAPDRIALYSYAHLPALFKTQRQIVEADLPDAAAKLAIMKLAIARLTDAGYDYIGMDHFARPDDELARAAAAGTLHRNFQGYSTQPDADLIAFGMSAISKVGASYSQNVKTLDEYYARLSRGELPTVRGIELTSGDQLRADVIRAVMCDFRLDIPAIEARHGIDFAAVFAPEMEKLADLAADGLVAITPAAIAVTPKGRLLVRSVAMVFDEFLTRGRRGLFSKAL